MKRNFCILFCLLLLIPVFLPAQTAALMEQLLGTHAVSYEQAAKFVLEAADLGDFSSTASTADAFNYAAERNWLPKRVSGSDEAVLQGVSLLIMQSFGFRGGLFYSMVQNPHYAYRELVYQEIIQGRTDPQMAVSGEYLLFMIGRALGKVEDEL